VALESLGCPEDALRAYQKTVDLEDNYPEAWYNIASVRNRQREYGDALQAARKAVSLNPDLPEAHFNEGVALGGRGDDQGALSAYDKAILLRPTFAEAWANRSAALHALNLDGPAVMAAKTAIRYDPNLAIAWFRRGVALALWPRSDRRRAALLAFCKALELDPQYHDAKYNMGVTLVDLGSMIEGVRWIRDARRGFEHEPEKKAQVDRTLQRLGFVPGGDDE
jgi:tetratricopeptide (TPR) repeat protein